MKKKWIITIALVLLLAVVITGIVQINKSNYAIVQKESVINPEITFSALIDLRNNPNWGEDDIFFEIVKRTGVFLEPVSLSGDSGATTKIMLASKNYPDLMLSVNNNVVSMFAEAGALVSLDDYISTRSSNIIQVFGDNLNKMRYNGDGAIYGVNREYKEQNNNVSNAIFNVQYEVLAEFGYPEIRTLDELYEYLLAYKKLYPEINGQPTIGYSFYTQSYGFNITVSNAALQAGGYQNDGLFCVDDDMNVRYVILTDAAHQYFQWLNKLYLADLLDVSSLVQSKDSLTEKARTGNVLAIPTEGWDIDSINSELRQNNLSNRCYAPLPLTLSEDIQSKVSVYDSTGSWKSVITDNCQDSARAFDFFDHMWSEEMQILCNWGIEGIHYDLVDGLRVVNQDVYATRNSDPFWSQKTGLMYYNYWSYGVNVKDSQDQYIVPAGNREDVIRSQDAETNKLLRAYNVDTFLDLCPKPSESNWLFAWKLLLPVSSDGALAEQKMESLRQVIVPKIILANTEAEFTEHWNELLAQAHEAGIQNREAEIRQALLNMG